MVVNGITFPVQSTGAQINRFNSSTNTRVFVYGSLRRGESLGHFLEDVAEWHGLHRTVDKYTLHTLQAFPAAVPGGTRSLVGEVYKMNKYYLRYLDKIEGTARGLYRRTPILVKSKTKGTHLAWIYLWGGATCQAPIIPTGDWMDR